VDGALPGAALDAAPPLLPLPRLGLWLDLAPIYSGHGRRRVHPPALSRRTLTVTTNAPPLGNLGAGSFHRQLDRVRMIARQPLSGLNHLILTFHDLVHMLALSCLQERRAGMD